jgi:hypothetical protein
VSSAGKSLVPAFEHCGLSCYMVPLVLTDVECHGRYVLGSCEFQWRREIVVLHKDRDGNVFGGWQM